MKRIAFFYVFTLALFTQAQNYSAYGNGSYIGQVTTQSELSATAPPKNFHMWVSGANATYRQIDSNVWRNNDSLCIANCRNVVNGIAGLDGSSKILTSAMPSTVMFYADSSSMLSPYLRKANVRDSARSAFSQGSNVTITNGVIDVASIFSKVYDKSGLLTSNAKYFCDTFTVSSATPTISLATYLSAASCTNFKLNSAVAYRVSATVSNSPNVTITAISSNSVTLILNQVNSSTVSILGISVLSGLPMVLVPDPTNIKVVLSFIMY